jgi:hypothetical protein
VAHHDSPESAERAAALPERLYAAGVAAGGVFVLLVLAEADGEFLRRRLWAFEHLRDWPFGLRLIACVPLAAAATARGRASGWRALAAVARVAAQSPRAALAAGCGACLALFWLLRQRNFELGDSALLIQLVTRYVHLRGFHVTYDEPLELYLHSIVYGWLHAWLDWSVADAYALSSALAGAAGVALVARLWRQAAPCAPRAALALALTGSTAAIQLYFGYVENYTLVATGLLAYVLLAWSCLQGRRSVVWPALALGWSVCLHVLAGWLWPTLLYLVAAARRRRGQSWVRAVLPAAAALLAPMVLTVCGLTAAGVPLAMLGKTHLAHFKFVFLTAPGTAQYQFPAFSAAHLAAQANQLLLAGLPGMLVLAWIAGFARREVDTTDPFLRFLGIGALSLQLFASTWNPELGAYTDWDLFAVSGFSLVLLAAYALVRLPVSDRRIAGAALPAWTLAVLLATSWVTSNALRTHEVDALHDDAHFRAALRHQRGGATDAALRDLQEAVRINPRNGPATLACADLLWSRGEGARASALLEAYLALEPGGPAAEGARRRLHERRPAGPS